METERMGALSIALPLYWGHSRDRFEKESSKL